MMSLSLLQQSPSPEIRSQETRKCFLGCSTNIEMPAHSLLSSFVSELLYPANLTIFLKSLIFFTRLVLGVRLDTWVIPCQICMKILDPFKNVIFVSYHHNQVPCDAFQPNLATLAHFRGHFWLWVRFRALWGSNLSFLVSAQFFQFLSTFLQ